MENDQYTDYLVYIRYQNGVTKVHRCSSFEEAKALYRKHVDTEFDCIKSIGYVPNYPEYGFSDDA